MRPLYESLSAAYPTPMRIFRFVISGGTATAVNLGALFVLTNFFGIWYLLSSVFAFIASFFVSFTMQKFWTFGDTSKNRAHIQAFRFLLVILMALSINTTLLFIFVEYAHLHYLLAQFLSGLVIAFINYFSYKHLVFGADIAELSTQEEKAPVPAWQLLGVALAAAIFLALALFHLPENPPTWLDEGLFTQAAINLAHHGRYAIQTAPGHFISADFLTTGFPVIVPLALSFSAFGTTLYNARAVMVLFMALLCVVSFLLIITLAGKRKHILALASLFLLVTFAPLYGHGKNVLGEVPGLMLFIASLLLLYKAEKYRALPLYVVAGILAGLSMATKPIYLLLIIPAALAVALIQRKHLTSNAVLAYGAGAFGVLVLWYFIHLGSLAALKEILFASNPNDTSLSSLIAENVRRFIHELQPLYFLGLISLWWFSLLFRAWRKVEISTVELFAAIFSVINLALFLMSRGFYRYFFPAETLALLFLPLAAYTSLANQKKLFIQSAAAFIVLLILFQGYQTLFKSWIAEFKDSTRSVELAQNLGDIPESKTIFLYNVPEAVIFLPHTPYYQYLGLGKNIIRGAEYLPALFAGIPDFVLVDTKFPDTERLAGLYTQIAQFDKYTLYEKTARK